MASRLNNYDGRRSPRKSAITFYEFERRDESSRIFVGLEFHAPACRTFTVEIDVNNSGEAFQPFERTKIAIGHRRGQLGGTGDRFVVLEPQRKRPRPINFQGIL